MLFPFRVQVLKELIGVLPRELSHRSGQLQEVVGVVKLPSELIDEVLGARSLELLLRERAEVVELDKRGIALHVLALLNLLLHLLPLQDLLDLQRALGVRNFGRLVDVGG